MNKPFVEVFDNIIPKNISDTVENLIFKKHNLLDYDLSPNWKFEPSLSNKETLDYGMGFQICDILKDNQLMKIPPNGFFYLNPLYYFAFSQNIQIMELQNARSWLTFPSSSSSYSENRIHNDRRNNKGIVDSKVGILLYYINDSDGDTILYENDKKTERKRITPKKGRCVFFSNLIPHQAGLPIKSPRAVINYNFLYIKHLIQL
jgi:hypothetical protein